MKLRNKDFDNIFDLVNHFKGVCEDKIIRLTYEPDFNVIEIEIVNKESFETLKLIRYTISSQEDIEELEDILEIYIERETFGRLEKLYTIKKEKWEE